MYETSDIRKGLRFEMDGDPYIVLEFQFVKPGKGTAFTRTKIRNLISGAVLDHTYKSGEKLKPADTEDREMQFLYSDGDFHFMDNNNYEQVSLESSVVGEAVNYLTENMMIEVSFFKGRSIGLSLPNFVVLEVIETAPGEKGNTVTGASKPAVVSTGYSVNVPLFVNEGDQLRVDTRTGEYVERVKG
ncbi:MAG: elongation factor P [Deltaproteobacteria bacterium]|nr:elongation factor P [Deltaproteobacteria bacterium]MDP6216898.1 elongation factor P [SAR324 cluster bacterium]RZO47530.1 MAG: elongation factor P [Pseudomonadota bacterium]MDC0224674.1 elongation factor P [Deltaproteobacteria bacterium]MDP6319439.1 elongation factor P [SAR324 cluster bacterium]